MRFRKTFPLTIVAVGLGILAAPVAETSDGKRLWRHGASLVGALKYPPGFDRFDYVDPEAPAGGRVNLSAGGTFDTFNPLPARGELAEGMGLVFEPLMISSLDEVSAQYGLIAESVSYPDDYSSVSYRLREEARWHDGAAITVEDVIWSFEKAVELDPQRQFYYQHVTGAAKTGAREVTFTFDRKNNRELPQIVGQLLVLPKHWWKGVDADGEPRSIGRTTLEPPLGSGPYRIANATPGSTVLFERVDDYWGKDLPVRVGSHNFGEIRYTYFTDRNVEFEAFKAGETDYWVENEARRWASGYTFPAVGEGRVVREELENPYRASGVMVGFAPNLRREKFADRRVRRALNFAFDFENLNRTIFFGQYQRVGSFFHGSALASTGLPEGRELAILETVRDKVPPQVFTEPYVNPTGGSLKKQRANLREAVRLFAEAGYAIRGGRMVDRETGVPFTFEILLNGPTIERVALPFAAELGKIGIDATVRSVDPAQYANRVRRRDFDMIYTGWSQSLSPGNEQFEYWGSKAADRQGSANYAGIDDPGIDALIERLVLARDRDDLIAATRALDRVLLAHDYVIPSYAAQLARIAYSSRLIRPDPLPTYAIGFPAIWWVSDAAR